MSRYSFLMLVVTIGIITAAAAPDDFNYNTMNANPQDRALKANLDSQKTNLQELATEIKQAAEILSSVKKTLEDLTNVDESVSPSKVVTKTKMIVPDNATKKDVKKIKSVLKKSIAASVGKKDSSDLKVTLDTATGVATTEISNLDPTSAHEIKEKVNSDDFVQHVKTSIKENKADLPQEIQNKITIDNDVQPNAVVVDETTDTDGENIINHESHIGDIDPRTIHTSDDIKAYYNHLMQDAKEEKHKIIEITQQIHDLEKKMKANN